MVMTHSLRKRFVKDYRLPITLLQDPYFDYFIDLYAHLNAREKYDLFVALVDRLDGEERFFAESKRIIQAMIDDVKSRPDYVEFSSSDLSSHKPTHSFEKASPVFRQENDGKWFTSIDLVKANWQCFDYYLASVMDYSPSYEDWASKFTDEPYYLESKQIRQVVFGSLNPKRQQIIQRFMMDQIWNVLDAANIPVVGATSDELIIPYEDTPGSVPEVIKGILPVTFNVHIDTYRLVRIGNKPYYKREYTNGSFDLKGVPAHYYPEVLQHVLGNETTEMDRTSFFEGRVVRFIEPLF